VQDEGFEGSDFQIDFSPLPLTNADARHNRPPIN
jgi:hypothetical protein